MPELGGDTALEQVLAEARDFGFAGIELGGRFPRDPPTLATLLARFQLVLVGGWYSASLLTRSARAEIAALQPHLGAAEGDGLHGVHPCRDQQCDSRRSQPSRCRRPRGLTAQAGRASVQQLTEVADHLAAAGLRLAYHHHLGTVVESGEDLERFLESTGPSVGMTIDTGHAALGGRGRRCADPSPSAPRGARALQGHPRRRSFARSRPREEAS